LNRERQRNEARFTKHILKLESRAGLTSIEVKDAEGQAVKLKNQTDIENALPKELGKRFNQAASMFLMKNHLQDIYPFCTYEVSHTIFP
jgi:hypothetical protein